MNFKIIFALTVLLGLFTPFFSSAQTDTIRHTKRNREYRKCYFYWGYNRAYFSKTNLHFHGPNYDFTLYDVQGIDRPERLDWTYFNPGTFTVPQYNFRFGYFLGRRFHVSFGMDHMKYVLTPYQSAVLSGVIAESASEKYGGAYLNTPVTVEPDLLMFEHTNGFNLTSFDLEYLMPITRVDAPWRIHWNMGLGGIWIVAKTDVRVFGDGLDNNFHVAGFTMAAKTGPRLEWRQRFFLTAEAKTGYASLPSVLIKNDAPELGDHNLTYFEWYVAAGFYFGKKH